MIKKLLLLLMFLVLAESSLAATIHGTVYDEGLDVVKDAIVEVDSVPKQREVAKDGTYSFTLSQGAYTITVKRDSEAAEEEISIEKEGDYVLDLFLFPSFEEEDELVKETGEISIDDEYFTEDKNKPLLVALSIIVVIIMATLVTYFLKYRKPEIKSGIEDIKEDDEAEKYLEFIKKHGGRVTQKDIRKNFPMSEAKISLIITELEHKGKVQKIKKGRSNVILLKK